MRRDAVLPTESDQEWLLANLGQLVYRHGPERLLDAPLIEPTDAFFPDAWTRDRRAVEQVARRLLDYAGLPGLGVEVEVDPAPEAHVALGGTLVRAWHPGAPAWFSGIARGRARFGCLDAHFDEPDVLVAHLCHEVAHAWRAHHREEEAEVDLEERLTDLTTIYLGFGIFTVNASFRFRTESDGIGSRWSTSRSGYLAPPHLAFLLAAQAVARDMGFCARRRLAGKLEGNQAGMFKAACRALSHDVDALRWRLGLPSDHDPGPLAL